MLLVVVDQARIGRRGQHAVILAGQLLASDVPVNHGRAPGACAYPCEDLQSRKSVERVATQELRRGLDRTAFATVLVTPVGVELRLRGEVEVEMRRPASRPSGARQDHTQDIGVLEVLDEGAEAE